MDKALHSGGLTNASMAWINLNPAFQQMALLWVR
jgi:hypothetical protein